jgi:Fe-Mn family superoxide dismutase
MALSMPVVKWCSLPALFVLLTTLTMSSDGQGISLPFHVLSIRADIYILPILPFDYDDLMPCLTREIITAHYEGHHENYRKKMNSLLNEWRESEPTNQLNTQPLAKIQERLAEVPEKFRTALKNNLGGYANHALYWAVMSKPNENGTARMPEGRILNEIVSSFGSYDEFKTKFTSDATTLFGSGYVWLVRDRSAPEGKQLSIVSTVNQDSPVTNGLHPILVIDVWEHAYYLKYQFRRAAYIEEWWKLINWDSVAQLDRWWKRVIDMDHEGRDEL